MCDRAKSPSPLWIVLYLTLNLLWGQFFPNGFFPSGPYLILPFSFLALFIIVGIARGQLAGTVKHLIGRWLPRRADLPIAVAFVMAALLVRVLLSRCFGLTPQPRQLPVVADLAALAPVNEELIFRGLFLGILLAWLPRARWVAVAWSAAIFLGFHSIAGGDVPEVALVFSFGLLSGAAYVATRCVPLCVACHVLFNVLTWCTDRPRDMDLPDVLLGLAFFVSGFAVIGWLLRVFIRRRRSAAAPNQRLQATAR